MRVFSCRRCGQLVFFENDACLHCGAELGYVPSRRELLTLEICDTGELAELVPGGDRATGERFARCANAGLARCNWLVPAGAGPGTLCTCCRLTRTRPNDDDAAGLELFAQAEAAKRRLVHQLLELHLPVDASGDEPALSFDLLAGRSGDPVTIGHAGGVITIDVSESDSTRREQVRQELDEPYRTMLGHFRHEVGHYYFDRLVAPRTDLLSRFRELFGDEQADYDQALATHYEQGPALDWRDRFVSAYATMHPWEDWAETFAHYLHITDTLGTASAFGLRLDGPVGVGPSGPTLQADPPHVIGRARPASAPFAELLHEWLPLTYALNAVNRSMGRDDLYPFVLAQPVIDKLAFVHDVVRAAATGS